MFCRWLTEWKNIFGIGYQLIKSNLTKKKKLERDFGII
jgi:hypothetical protein